ncbi:DEAD/DEAH box helicase family protein [Lysobacter capsici]|uniref:DEAD/DEAH box helicase n=1 Tax=Lysobacter capsici TaxID=435897 RepID=UPI00178208E7|nr:DEAD/DEAH box helicase family protein [Lysobacter capsici]UOF15581.1 DEAD/DEAH box helicase family protein [Lysobacter capsici]
MPSFFSSTAADIIHNPNIRTPQKGAFEALAAHAASDELDKREVGIVLPVGCGKSGAIAISPFAYGARRVLVIAPGLRIAEQLQKDFDPTSPTLFYRKTGVLRQPPYPEPVEIRGTTTNRSDLEEADVVITNIQQLQGGASNKWLSELPNDFFDLILFDEGHHSVAESWAFLKEKFNEATIVNFSATPARADGQIMAGKILYSYPIFDAIQAGYVKRLKAVQLNPRTLKYVRREDNREIEVGLAEVKRLGETEADFRRSIVTSAETLATIADASIRELQRLRENTGEQRLKIIASALNYEHCRQIVEAYRARGCRSDYVHSKEDGAANDAVMKRLESHELDVIVQVRKLGEGFDHPHLSVAAVFSIFSNLSPFVQFVGRIMRVIVQNSPNHPLNNGVVVFHAGANIARQWSDFQSYSEADQDYFEQLLPLEEFDSIDPHEERVFLPQPHDMHGVEVKSQSDVLLEEIPLLNDEAAVAALKLLQERGYSADDISAAASALEPVPTTKAKQRQAKRGALDTRVKTEAARILHQRKIPHEGHQLDRKRLGKSNFVVLKSAIDRQIKAALLRKDVERHDYSRDELDAIDDRFAEIVEAAILEVFNGQN